MEWIAVESCALRFRMMQMHSQAWSPMRKLAGTLMDLSEISSSINMIWRKFGSSSAPTGQSAAIIKQLRERSGAPISDVKNMLIKHGWDVEEAFGALRKKGLAAAAKKASHHAAEGLVGASFGAAAATAKSVSSSMQNGGAGRGGVGSVVVVELNSQTDFVARNSLFQGLLNEIIIAAQALGQAATVGPDHSLNLDELLTARTPSGALVSEAVTEVAAQVGENVRIRRAFRIDSEDGLVFPYVHQAVAPGLGKLAAVVRLRSSDGSPLDLQDSRSGQDSLATTSLLAAGAGLAMQVAGMRPTYQTRASVPADVLARERELLTQQLRLDAAFLGKPPQVMSQAVEGRLGKLLGEWCMDEQRYVLDDDITVGQLMARLRKDVGRPVQVSAFLRVQCGEGLQSKGGDDFATEVARIVTST